MARSEDSVFLKDRDRLLNSGCWTQVVELRGLQPWISHHDRIQHALLGTGSGAPGPV